MAARNMATPLNAGDSDDLAFTITRTFDAPASVVFQLWTKPHHLKRWWGSIGFVALSFEMDVRPGGAWNCCLRSPDGTELRERGVYREIVEAKKLIFTYAADHPDGNPGHQTLVTVDFAALGSKTKVTLRQAAFESIVARDEYERGWPGCLERFAEYLANNLTEKATDPVSARLQEAGQ
jgi:uncharacterized protein YndB with AHSA1/START domain